MLSEAYSRVFNIKHSRILGLTATPPPPEKGLNKLCPILHTITLARARGNNLVSNYQIFNIPVTLTLDERRELQKADNEYNRSKKELSNWAQTVNLDTKDILEVANAGFKQGMGFSSKRLYLSIGKRKRILYSAKNKLESALKIIEKWKDKKWITFDKYITNAEQLCEKLNERGIPAVVYHSQMPDKDRLEALEKVKSDDIRVICTVDALNAGFDLPDIDAAIALSYVSSTITSIQTLGRTLRLNSDPNKTAAFFNLYVKDTREENWLKSKLSVVEEARVSWPSNLNYVNYG
jgi:superfamily II DNA or RNA helicase